MKQRAERANASLSYKPRAVEATKLRHDASRTQGTPETERKPISRYRVHNTVPCILPNPLTRHPNTHKPGTLNISPSHRCILRMRQEDYTM